MNYFSLEAPIDLRHEMTMAAPAIVFRGYGIPAPIRFNPKIKHAPAKSPMAKTRTMSPTMVPTRRALLPLDFPINFPIESFIILLSGCLNIRS